MFAVERIGSTLSRSTSILSLGSRVGSIATSIGSDTLTIIIAVGGASLWLLTQLLD